MKSKISEPLVSVLIPVYNTPPSIFARALESISHQSYKNIEVIIVDDGSSMPITTSFISEFPDLNVLLLRLELNSGISAALNKGIDCAKGEIIIRFDSDDIMLPERIADQVNLFRNNDVDVVFSQMLVNGLENIYFFPVSPKAIEVCMMYGNPVPHPASAIRSNLLRKYKYVDWNGIKGLEDYYLWARILNGGGKFQGLHSFGVNYIESPRQVTKSTKLNQAYLEALKSISLINYVGADHLELYALSYLRREMAKLQGVDLQAFRMIVASSIKRVIRSEKQLLKKVRLIVVLIIVIYF